MTIRLSCPVDDCGADIDVDATPARPSRGWDQHEGGTIDDIEATCEHQNELDSGAYDEDLWAQIDLQEAQ